MPREGLLQGKRPRLQNEIDRATNAADLRVAELTELSRLEGRKCRSAYAGLQRECLQRETHRPSSRGDENAHSLQVHESSI